MKKIFSIVLLFLPHFFVATLSRRKDTDKRLFKYFLPYGYMKKRMKYVFRANVGDDKKDCGISGLFRWICPYGIILWWDGGCDVVIKCSTSQASHVQPVTNDIRMVNRQIESLRREVVDSSERLELLMLRFVETIKKN